MRFKLRFLPIGISILFLLFFSLLTTSTTSADTAEVGVEVTINMTINPPDKQVTYGPIPITLKQDAGDALGMSVHYEYGPVDVNAISAQPGQTSITFTQFINFQDVDLTYQDGFYVCVGGYCSKSFNFGGGVLATAPPIKLDAGAAEEFNQSNVIGPIAVKVNIEGNTEDKTYGPITLELIATDAPATSATLQKAKADTNQKDAKASESTVTLDALFEAVKPTYGYSGYQVCVLGMSDTCSTIILSTETGPQNVTITLSQEQYSKAVQNTAAGSNASGTTCSIDGVGWIVCPITRFLSGIADSAFKYLSNNFLEVSAYTFSSSDNGTREAWSNMRNIANVAFVLAFLVIIFMQITGIDKTSYGLNYGVKKMLPRLIIAAILVNVSYFLCQIAVDISNILGYSFEKSITALVPSSTSSTMGGYWSGADNKVWQTLAASVLSTAVIGTFTWIYITALIPVLLAAVVALVTIFFILIARQALIILLVVVSPLAFVAYLLPNTEPLFKKWRKTFLSLLMVFPIVGLVFGVSKLASGILFSAFSTAGNSPILGQIMAACVLVLPLFVVPSLLRKSLDAAGNIGASINGIGNNLSGRASTFGKGVGDRLDTRMNNAAMNNPRWFNPRSHLMRYRARRDSIQKAQESSLRTGIGNYINEESLREGSDLLDRMASGSANVEDTKARIQAEAEKEMIDAAKPALAREIAKVSPAGRDAWLKARASDKNYSAAQRAAAMHELSATGRDGIVRELQKDFESGSAAGDKQAGDNLRMLNEAVKQNYSGLVGKAPDLIKSEKAFKSINGKMLSQFSQHTAKAHMEYLQDLYNQGTASGNMSEYDAAVEVFNNAITDIQNTPSLQAEFDPDAGKAYLSAYGGMPGPIGGLLNIDTSGKIR